MVSLRVKHTNADDLHYDPMAIQIEQVTSITDEIISELARLLPQLSTTTTEVSVRDLQSIIQSPCVVLLLARDTETHGIVGTLTLVVFRIPTGIRAWIEDVVVDESERGRGAGELLTRAAITQARERGACTLDLTSRPFRQAANRLYQRVGFERRDTNVYRLKLQ